MALDFELRSQPLVRGPEFYDLETTDGHRYGTLVRLRRDALETTVVQTCTRYTAEATRCRFCTLEEPMKAGVTTQVKWPEQLAEVARAAVDVAGMRRMVMTTGTSTGRDRGAKHLARCVEAVRAAAPELEIHVECEPPRDLEWIDALYEAGAASLALNVESLDETARRRWTPGKATVSLAAYERAWMHAVSIFGRNRVSTNLLVGLGEDADELVEGAEWLIAMGVRPVVVPYRPAPGGLAWEPAADPELLRAVTARVDAAQAAAQPEKPGLTLVWPDRRKTGLETA